MTHLGVGLWLGWACPSLSAPGLEARVSAEPQLPVKVSSQGGPELELMGNPDFGWAECKLGPGQTVLVEGGAMSTMSEGLGVRTRLLGGFFRAIIRKLFGGESAFVGEYSGPGWLTISPSVPGRVIHRRLSGETVFLQGGSFLACTPGIDLGVKFGGLRSFFSGEGAFFLVCTGQGDLLFNAHGDIVEREVTAPLIVDTGHVVGWESTLEWRIRGMGGIKSTLLSGEGLVIEFTGRGKVWLQTRTEGGLAGWLSSYTR